ncbi:MAG TPA: site-specific integrase [Terriglobia bacterium]|nr:site-specific integrase [Terriglobia bacterium]
MAIFKRGNSKIYHYNFWWKGEHVQESTRQGNPRVARQMEAAHRTRLAKGEVGITERKPAPLLKDFAQRFIDSIQVRCAEKPATVRFYAEKLRSLLSFEPLANARLDQIDESLIESFVQEASKAPGVRNETVVPATVNRKLAVLRRALRLAYEWHVIDRVPRIRLLPGEQNRELVLSHADEEGYLSACPQPLRDIALTILDCGLRTSEALTLEWRNVHLEPAPGAKYGYIHIERGKSRNAKRNVPITDRLAHMLLDRSLESKSLFVFPSETGQPYRVTSVDHDHAEVRAALGMPAEFVIYSLRHTYGTRLGEAGADAFAIMRLMGHSSVTVSQRYVHPSPEALERAVERLQAMNESKRLPDDGKRRDATAISTTPHKALSVSC